MSGLTRFTVPETVNFIDEEAFSDCLSLTEFEFEPGSRVTKLSQFMFTGSAIRSIEIPASVKIISYGVFLNSKLADIKFADGSCLENIYADAFKHILLTKIEIPASVEQIGESTFAPLSGR